MVRRLIIDCDPGIDDAVMLMLAVASRSLDIAAIMTVAGNVPLELTNRNARMVLEFMGRQDIPVHCGCPRPMLRKAVTAEDFHGETGIAGMNVFEPQTPAAPGHAVDALIALCRAAAPASLTLVVSGPMTNLACALVMAPDIAAAFAEIVVMAGAQSEGGNITPYAEFNVFADPQAAAIVFSAGLPTTVLSLDVTHAVRAEPAYIARLRRLSGPRSAMLTSLLDAANRLEQSSKPGRAAPMHDPATIVWLLAPHIFTFRPCRVSVVTAPGKRFGQTRVRFSRSGPHRWVETADADAFFGVIETVLGKA